MANILPWHLQTLVDEPYTRFLRIYVLIHTFFS